MKITPIFSMDAVRLLAFTLPAASLFAQPTLDTIFQLELDGAIEGDGTTYSGDSGTIQDGIVVTVGEDEFGNAPDFFSSPGEMLMDSTSSITGSPYPKDEVLLVNVGTGYTLEQSFVIEAWINANSSLFQTSGNNFNNTFIWSWWEIGDWCDIDGTVSDNLSLYRNTGNSAWTRLSAGTFSAFFNNPANSPEDSIPQDEYAHVAIIWTWNSTTLTGRAEYYINGDLKLTGNSTQPTSGFLPETIAFGNLSFTSLDDQCLGDINYNAGFSGSFDSIALSTFDGDFGESPIFALFEADPLPTEWAGFPLSTDLWADTGDWMGFVNVTFAPWVYNFTLDTWVFVREENIKTNGAWMYFLK